MEMTVSVLCAFDSHKQSDEIIDTAGSLSYYFWFPKMFLLAALLLFSRQCNSDQLILQLLKTICVMNR